MPRVEVVRQEPQEQARRTRTTSSCKTVGEEDSPSREKGRHAVLEFVVQQLNRDLFVELMDSF